MTWKKRQDHVMDGDICEPSEWRINNNEFSSEFNGFLDSDNIREKALSCEQVKRDTFTKVLIDQSFMGYDYLFSHKRSGFSSIPDYKFVALDDESNVLYRRSEFGGVANGFNFLTISSSLDADMATFYSAGGSAAPTSFKSEYGSDVASAGDLGALGFLTALFSKASSSDPDRECRLPYFKFKTEGDALLIVDFCGTVQSHHGFTLNNAKDAAYWCSWWSQGYTKLSEDSQFKINSIGYPYRLRQANRTPEKSALILCSIWRVLVDGKVLATTGMLGPELEAQPIYLTGAIPVTSGEHVVEVQGKTCWYCPATGKEVPSSGLNTSVTWTPTAVDGTVGAENAIFGGSSFHEVRENIRKDISLRQPNLIVQVRSR